MCSGEDVSTSVYFVVRTGSGNFLLPLAAKESNVTAMVPTESVLQGAWCSEIEEPEKTKNKTNPHPATISGGWNKSPSSNDFWRLVLDMC